MQLSQPIKDILAARQPPFPWHERWDSTNIVRILVAEEILADTIEADTIIVNNNFLGPVVFIGPDPPPGDIKPGQLWWRNDPDGVLYVWYDDGNSTQWVPCTPVPSTEPGVGGPSLWADDAAGNVLLPVNASRGILWAGPTSKSRLTWSATPFASQWRVNVNAAGVMDDATKPALWASIEPTAAQSRIAFYWSPAGASVGTIGMPFSFNMVTGTMDIHSFIGDAIQMGGQSVKGRLVTGEAVADRGLTGLRSNRTYRDFVDDPAAPSWKLDMGGPVGVFDTFDIARSPSGTTAAWVSLLHLDSNGKLTIGADPIAPLDVATKRYVDARAGLWGREYPPGSGGNLIPMDPDIGGIRVAPLSRGHGYLGLSMGVVPGDSSLTDMEVYLHGDPTALTIASGGGKVNVPGVNYPGQTCLWIQNQGETFIEGTWGGCVKLPMLTGPDGERLVVVGGVTIGAALRVDEGTLQYKDGHFQGRNASAWVFLDETGGGGGGGAWIDGPGATLMPSDPAKVGIRIVNTAAPAVSLLTLNSGTDAGHPTGWEVTISGSAAISEYVGGDDMYLTPQLSDMAIWIGQAKDPYGCVGIGTDDGGGNPLTHERLMVAGGVQIGNALTTMVGTLQYQAGRFQGRNGGGWVFLDAPAATQYYLLAGAGAGKPSSALSVGLYVAAVAFSFPVGLTGSQGKVKVASTAPATFSIWVNGFIKGYMEFAAGSLVAGFTWVAAVGVAVGDVIEITAPGSVDATLSDPAWTLRGVI